MRARPGYAKSAQIQALQETPCEARGGKRVRGWVSEAGMPARDGICSRECDQVAEE